MLHPITQWQHHLHLVSWVVVADVDGDAGDGTNCVNGIDDENDYDCDVVADAVPVTWGGAFEVVVVGCEANSLHHHSNESCPVELGVDADVDVVGIDADAGTDADASGCDTDIVVVAGVADVIQIQAPKATGTSLMLEVDCRRNEYANRQRQPKNIRW